MIHQKVENKGPIHCPRKLKLQRTVKINLFLQTLADMYRLNAKIRDDIYKNDSEKGIVVILGRIHFRSAHDSY